MLPSSPTFEKNGKETIFISGLPPDFSITNFPIPLFPDSLGHFKCSESVDVGYASENRIWQLRL